MVEIRHLKLITTIHKAGSLSEAAKVLHLTPSALSHQLKQLESSLDTAIFYRTNNQLLFTPSGKEFLKSAKEILSQLSQMKDRIQDIEEVQLEKYIHGFSQEETRRLYDQASSIEQFLHWDSTWPDDSLILEAGCGVGAQTKIIAPKNPNSKFIAVDLSEKSLKQAASSIQELDIKNVVFQKADIKKLPYADNHFDHVFVCFVLEHVSQPIQVLKELKRVLKTGGTITVIEGDHGSTYFYPDSIDAQNAIQAQVNLQQQNGGNANIGRSIFPMLQTVDFKDIIVNPRQIYVDESKPKLVEGFIKNTFTAMIKGIAEEAIAKKIISKETMSKGIEDLLQTANGGTFCYTFFKGRGTKGESSNSK